MFYLNDGNIKPSSCMGEGYLKIFLDTKNNTYKAELRRKTLPHFISVLRLYNIRKESQVSKGLQMEQTVIINTGGISFLSPLVELHLDSNPIPTIPDDAFASLAQLKVASSPISDDAPSSDSLFFHKPGRIGDVQMPSHDLTCTVYM